MSLFALLQTGWSGASWARAAEIIRHTYHGWAAKDVAAIRRFLSGLAAIPDLRLITVSHVRPIRDAPAAKLRALAP